MSSSTQGQCEPHDSKKQKNLALPSLFSKLRNAKAVIGRAADDLHEREIRPLLGSGSNGSGASIYCAPNRNDLEEFGVHGNNYGGDRANMKRSAATSLSSTFGLSNSGAATRNKSTAVVGSNSSSALRVSSLSTAFHNISARVENQLRKRNRDANNSSGKSYRVTILPHAFLAYFGCFFIGFPVVLLLYVFARQAVFGDEGVVLGTEEHKYEVPDFKSEFSPSKGLSGNAAAGITAEIEQYSDPNKKEDTYAKKHDGGAMILKIEEGNFTASLAHNEILTMEHLPVDDESLKKRTGALTNENNDLSNYHASGEISIPPVATEKIDHADSRETVYVEKALVVTSGADMSSVEHQQSSADDESQENSASRSSFGTTNISLNIEPTSESARIGDSNNVSLTYDASLNEGKH